MGVVSVCHLFYRHVSVSARGAQFGTDVATDICERDSEIALTIRT